MQEQSLLADLRSVVARALSGLDMFSSDGGLDGIISPPPGEVRQRGVPGGTAPSSAEKGGGVERRVTVMEGLFKGLQTNPGAAPGAAAGLARCDRKYTAHSAVWALSCETLQCLLDVRSGTACVHLVTFTSYVCVDHHSMFMVCPCRTGTY